MKILSLAGVPLLWLAVSASLAAAGAPWNGAKHYWDRPIPAQGRPPSAYLPIARSLHPTSCAACHPRQFADWSGSLHAHAFSPGLIWQLMEASPAERESCQTCHAPLTEQLSSAPGGGRNPIFDAALQQTGVSCAVCHVRNNARFGPPTRPGDRPCTFVGMPHGHVTTTRYFESANFCAACHQFPAGSEAPNGKPIENTVAEWRASRYAAEGISCQTCHMPDRRHLFRGIHDPAMVRKGITLTLSDHGATLTNSGVGHMFPTYLTPEVVLEVESLDRAGRMLASRSATIQRVVDLSVTPSREVSDTRLPPGGSRTVSLPDDPREARVRAKVVVYPDAYYHDMYKAAWREPHSRRVRAWIAKALARSGRSWYVADQAQKVVSGVHEQAPQTVSSAPEKHSGAPGRLR